MQWIWRLSFRLRLIWMEDKWGAEEGAKRVKPSGQRWFRVKLISQICQWYLISVNDASESNSYPVSVNDISLVISFNNASELNSYPISVNDISYLISVNDASESNSYLKLFDISLCLSQALFITYKEPIHIYSVPPSFPPDYTLYCLSKKYTH